MRLLDDEVGLPSCLVACLLGGALCRDERRAQQLLELPVLGGFGLKIFDLVGEVGAFAPDILEAVGDVQQQPLDDPAAVAAKPRSAKLYVSDLYWGERHRT